MNIFLLVNTNEDFLQLRGR